MHYADAIFLNKPSFPRIEQNNNLAISKTPYTVL
jgi:hypothetical protein